MGKKKKSRPGEGSVYQRQDGRWVATAQINGKRKAFYAESQPKAIEKRKEALRKVARDEYVEPSRQTVEEYLKYWLSIHGPSLPKKSSAQSYEERIRLYLAPYLGHIKLQKLTTPDIQKMYGAMIARGLSPSTVHAVHQTLKVALKDAVEWGRLTKNPCQSVKLPARQERKQVILDIDQARHLIQAARDELAGKEYIGAAVLLFIGTGMRIGELCSLHWREVDFEKREIRISGTLSYDRDGHALYESDPKSRTSQRVLPLPNIALEALSAHKHNQIEQRLDAKHWVLNDLVFASLTSTSGHMWRESVRRRFYTFLKQHDLPYMHPHDLRHNVATALIAAGIPAIVVQGLLGHSNVSTTLNIYAHVTPQMQQIASDEIDKLFG